MSQLSALLQELTQEGNDIQANKYFSASVTALLFYDYALTFEDEVRYAWGGRKTWIFYLFILNRYLPMVYKIWAMIEDYSPKYTEELCSNTAILQPIFFIWSTLLAQIFLMLRVYALSGKNKIILGGFSLLAIIQALVGILFTAIPPSSIVKPPSIPLDVFHICVFDSKTRYETAYVWMSLLYDTVAFISIVRLSLRGVGKISTIVATILQDATVYFLIIFTSHADLAFFIIFARESLKLTPAIGGNVLIPLMVTRLLLSLRKASDPKTIAQWNMDHFTSPRTFTTVTTTEGHYTPSDTPDSAMTRVSQYDVLDSVFELSDLSSQDEGHPGASDGKV